MKIIFSRHAKRQMKWRKITGEEVKSAINDPDMLVDTIKGRKNAFKIIGGQAFKDNIQAGGRDSNRHNGNGKR